jgi:hypothetical protein
MFHPSVHVLSLDDTDDFYLRVFGRPSTRLSTAPQDPDNRNDYTTFTTIRDVLLDSIDPTRTIRDGKQQYPSITEPHLKGFGWYVEGVTALWRRLRADGRELVGVGGAKGTADEPPMVGPYPMFFTDPDDVGLRYQFVGPQPLPMPPDPRISPGWQLPRVDPADPFGIEFTSHHTVLTDQPDRALSLFVDVLGGTVLRTGRNDVLGADSAWVRLGDTSYEFAVPDHGTPAHDDWKTTAPRDCYHAITFKVGDLDMVRAHLSDVGVALRCDTPTLVVADPTTSQGIPWGFTTEVIPGDHRVWGGHG